MKIRKRYPIVSFIIVMAVYTLYSMFFVPEYYKVSETYFDANSDFEHLMQIHALKDGYFLAGKEKLEFFDRDGDQLWERKVYQKDYFTASNTDKIVVSEYKTGEVNVLNQKGALLYKEELLGRIKEIKFYPQDTFVLNMDNDKIIVGNEKLAFIDLPKGSLIQYEYGVHNRSLVMCMLDNRLGSTLLIATLTGQISSGSNLGASIPLALTLEKSNIQVICDDSIKIFGYDGNLISESMIEGELLFASNELYTYRNEQGIYIKHSKGTTKIPNDDLFENNKIKHIKLTDDRIMLITDNELVIYSLSGSKVFQKEYDTMIVNIHPINNDHFGLELIGKIEFFQGK